MFVVFCFKERNQVSGTQISLGSFEVHSEGWIIKTISKEYIYFCSPNPAIWRW